ncbi:C6 finger domain protein [Talaromyces pinophilus]|uniref:C6 finger domain protein n=1 Tax=Talaromyces pinophilus TaxID=128442 RepID=A0A6V8HPF6_TALPI|nr:C6 finger domain protein [Talaromyces pinophilus]
MATENPTTGSVFAEYIPNSPILHGHFEMSETQPGHVPNGASPTPTATATATPDATTPAPAPAPAPATVAAPAPTPTPPTSTPAPAPASAPAQEPLAAPAAPPAPPAPTVFDTVPSTSFPPLPHISTDDFERTTDFTSTAPSAPVPSQNVANSGVPTTSFTAVNAPPAVSGPVPTSMPSPAPAPAAATAPAQTFSAPPAVATNAPIQTYSSAPAPTPAPASAPVPAPVPAPQAVSTTAPAPSQAPLSLPPTTYTPVPLSVPPPPPVATSAPPQSPSVTPGGPPPPSMSQYQSTPNVPPSNPPPMQGQPPMQSMGQYNPAYSPQMGQMGYDPGFRPQPAPSDIRPASNTPQPSLLVNPQENHNSNNNPYPSAPPGYIPASAQPFAPSVQSDSSIQSFDQSNNNRQGPAEPSVEESDTMSVMASVQDTIDGSMSQPVGTPDLSTPALMPLSGQVGRQEKVKIQDLLALQGIAPPPPYPIVPIQQARLDQIQTVYLHTYAPAIDRFLETRWFRDKGLSQLLTNAQLMAQYSALIDAFNDPKIDDIAVRGRVESFEASVVWDTMSICRSARNLVRNGSTEPMQEYDLLTTANRFDILEALITDDHLKDNPLRADLARPPPTNLNPLEGQLRTRSLNFWNCIGHFLTLHDNEASSAVEIDETLARCRSLLDEIENRDVLYSMAIGRHLGQRLSDFHPRNRPENSSDERNANTKLIVAQRFIEDESKDKGTTQVVKRLCGMVHRLWELKNLLLPRA